MFDPQSRYFPIETSTVDVADGEGGRRLVRFVRRRIIPPTEDTLTLVEHLVIDGERLDNITALYLGDPTQFWRVCDANKVLRPTELTDEPGRRIRVAMPKF